MAGARNLCAWAGVAIASGPWLMGLSLWLRRSQAGAIRSPSTSTLLLAGIGLVMAASAARLLWSAARPARSPKEGAPRAGEAAWRRDLPASGGRLQALRTMPSALFRLLPETDRPAGWLLTAGVLVAAGSLTFSSGPWPGLIGLWALAVAEPIAWQVGLRRRSPAGSPGGESVPTVDPGQITQQWTRRVDAKGQESVQGLVRAEFQAHERATSAHVAFCPPLPCAPAIETRQMSGPAAQIKVSQSHTFGARFEIKLAASGPACNITFRFHASTPSARPLP